MAISKKIRFEVFKRDGFKCAYCGNNPPAVILEVDHIEAKSTGGNDDINNLITSCFSCNRGKRDISLKKIPAKLQENIEIIKEQENQIKEYRKFINKIENRIKKDIEEINLIYSSNYPEYEFSYTFKNISLKRFLSLLPKHEIIDSLNLAISKFRHDKDSVIRYFCGICWSKIKSKEEVL